MCNPPFFDVTKTLPLDTATGKSATASETVTSGGEVAFVNQMVEESARDEWRKNVVWFTSMVGKKASLKPVAARLRAIGAQSIRTTRLVQGQTSRWAIAWSFIVSCPIGMVVSREEGGEGGEGGDGGDGGEGAADVLGKSGMLVKVERTFVVLEMKVSEAQRRIAECMSTLVDESESEMCSATTRDATKASSFVHVVARDGGYVADVWTSKTETGDGGSSSSSGSNGCSEGGGSMIQIHGNVRNHALFERFCSKLEKDVRRTGRQWRRKLKRLGVVGSAGR